MSSNVEIATLETFLSGATIPEIKPQPKTFLGIAKQPHYENVISNIYAFYFDVNEAHGLGDLFIRSLQEIISDFTLGTEKSGLENFEAFEISTEWGTDDGGRIDLLLHNHEQAIIIENKIYHHLSNNLIDYWETIKKPSKNKMGIVLSLFPISITGHKDFINITHLQLIEKIQSRLGNYILQADQKYLVFLKDFFQNIINMSTKQLGEEELDFFFSNLSKIQSIKKLDKAVYNHIVHQIELAGHQLEGQKLVTPRANSGLDKRVRYYVSSENTNLVIAVIFDEVINNKQLTLKVQLKNDLLKERAKYWNLKLSEQEGLMKNDKFEFDNNMSWSDFVIKTYTLNWEDITNLSDYILDRLEKDHFLSIFKKLEDLVPKSNKK